MPGRRHAGSLPSREPWLPSGNRCQGCKHPTRQASPRPADRERTNNAGTSRRRRPPIGLPSDTVFRLSVTAAHPPPTPDPVASLDAFQFRARGLINAANHPSTRAAGVDRRVGRAAEVCGRTHNDRVARRRCVSVCVDTQTIATRSTKPRGKSGMKRGCCAPVVVHGNPRYEMVHD